MGWWMVIVVMVLPSKWSKKCPSGGIFQVFFESKPCVVWQEGCWRRSRGIVSLRRRHSVPTLDTQLCDKGRNSIASREATCRGVGGDGRGWGRRSPPPSPPRGRANLNHIIYLSMSLLPSLRREWVFAWPSVRIKDSSPHRAQKDIQSFLWRPSSPFVGPQWHLVTALKTPVAPRGGREGALLFVPLTFFQRLRIGGTSEIATFRAS